MPRALDLYSAVRLEWLRHGSKMARLLLMVGPGLEHLLREEGAWYADASASSQVLALALPAKPLRNEFFAYGYLNHLPQRL